MPILIPIPPPSPFSPAEAEVIEGLVLPMIKFFQQLEVYDELGVPDPTAVAVRFGYDHWRSDMVTEFRKTTDSGVFAIGVGTGITSVDFTNGTIALTDPLASGDEVRATYRFKYFEDPEFQSFLRYTLLEINSRKPISAFTLEAAPLEWDATLALGVYIQCIKRLLLDNLIWRSRLIFPEPVDFKSYLKALKDEAATLYETNIKSLKRRILGARPAVVSSGKFFTQQLITEVNWRRFTVVGASG